MHTIFVIYVKTFFYAFTFPPDQWQSRNVAIVVVSFGVEAGAVNWLKQTGCQLDLYLDPDRKLYRKFGLHRSVQKVSFWVIFN